MNIVDKTKENDTGCFITHSFVIQIVTIKFIIIYYIAAELLACYNL